MSQTITFQLVTTDDTITVAAEHLCLAGCAGRTLCVVTGFDGTDANTYRRNTKWKNIEGTLTKTPIGTDIVSQDNVAWNATVTKSGEIIQFKVTGAIGDTITWKGSMRIL